MHKYSTQYFFASASGNLGAVAGIFHFYPLAVAHLVSIKAQQVLIVWIRRIIVSIFSFFQINPVDPHIAANDTRQIIFVGEKFVFNHKEIARL